MKLLLAYIKQLPEALRMQMFLRLGSGATALLLFLIVWVVSGEFAFALPCLILAVFLLINSWSLFRTVIVGDYLCVSGPCEEVERTVLSRRIKSITVRLGDKLVLIPIKRRVRKLMVGTKVTLYISEKTPVYDKDGLCHIYEYLAVSFGA